MLKKMLLGSFVGLGLLSTLAVPGHAEGRAVTAVSAIRHELVTLPYYNVFDWLEGEMRTDGSVILRGEVTLPSTREDAEMRVRKVEGVTNVVNEIKVLPPGSADNNLGSPCIEQSIGTVRLCFVTRLRVFLRFTSSSTTVVPH